MRHSVTPCPAHVLRSRVRSLLFVLAVAFAIPFFSVSGCTTQPQSEPVQTGCPGSQDLCGQQCVDKTRDALNCGSCGNACANGSGCQGSSCVCQAGLTPCNGQCVNTAADGLNCNGCGVACEGGLLCSLGTCSSTCAPGLEQCGTSCVDKQTNVASCGACDNACPAGRACTAGACACEGTQLDCGAGCVDPTTNASHCGQCNQACSGNQQCLNSACQCPPGQTCTQGVGGAGGGGSAGAASGGGGGAGGSAGASGGTGGGSSGVVGGGYIVNGSWHGYAFTAVGGVATITPPNFGDVTDFPLCASGTVQNANDNVAMLGWNLNQAINEEGENHPALTVSPLLKGIYITLDNPGKSTLRLQIQSADGATNPLHRWCATIPGAGGFIGYDAFNTECWAGGKGVAYANEPIVSALVLVPGNPLAAVPFDFCVKGLVEADGDANPPGAGCSLSEGPGEGGGNVTGTDTRTVTRKGRQYVVQNNVWNGNASAQTIDATGVSFTVSQQGNSQATTGAPASFPSVFIGNNFGHGTSGSNLPKQVSQLVNVPTGWRWSGGSGEFNAAYDVWFSSGSGGDAQTPSGGYLMVWFRDPPSAQPLGAPAGTESLAGRSWTVWSCPGACQLGKPVISYVPVNGASVSEMSFDLNDFIQNAVTKYPTMLSSSWYLTNIFAGFEIWSGGQNAKTSDFCAIVE